MAGSEGRETPPRSAAAAVELLAGLAVGAAAGEAPTSHLGASAAHLWREAVHTEAGLRAMVEVEVAGH